jgi:glycosyltransferase involved in cell wall biosynthesis
MATNKETADILHRAGAQQVIMRVDGGVVPDLIPAVAPVRQPKGIVQFLWAGRMEPRKGLSLALEAFAAAGSDLPAKLVVLGKGRDRPRCEAAVERLGIGDRVTFLGWVAWQQMPALFLESDAFLFTSIQDSFGSVLLEAMSQGLPVIAMDHQGAGAFVPEAAGIKVPVTTPSAVREGIAAAIRRMTESYPLRQTMGAAAWEFAQTQKWDRRATAMLEIYNQLKKAPEAATSCHSEAREPSPS